MTLPTLCLDVETSGLDARRDRLVLVGLLPEGEDDPDFLRHPTDRDLIQGFLELPTTFVGHNVGFDMHFLECAGYRIPPPERWLDTQLEAHVAGVDGERKGGNTALDRLAKRLIEMGELPSEILEPEKRIKAWLRTARREARKAGRHQPQKGDAPGHLLRPYLQADLTATRAVHEHYGAAVNGQGGVLELECRCLPAVFAAERRGVPIDTMAARQVLKRSSEKLQELHAHLFELAGEPFLLNSARQVEKALQRRAADLATVKRTPTGLLATSASALELIDDELTSALLEHRAERVFHALLENLIERTHDGRLYGSFRQVGTETGRMSSGQPNLQNIPATDLRARYCIRAPEGCVLVGADLNNVELRILACYAPGGTLERELQDGGDLHQKTANALGIEKDAAKRLNFGILYGAGVPRVQPSSASTRSRLRPRGTGGIGCIPRSGGSSMRSSTGSSAADTSRPPAGAGTTWRRPTT